MKKALALIVTLTLLIALASGCAGSQTPTPEASAEAAPAESNAPESQQAPTESEAATEAINEFAFPIAESKTLSLWIPWPGMLTPFAETPADSIYYQELQARTNVEIEFRQVNAETTNETFNLMCASGDYTDMMVNAATNYSKGGDAAISEEVILPLNDYVESYAPNFWNLVNSSEGALPQLLTDDGNIAGFYCICYEPTTQELGYLIRQDWLKKAGLEVPETLDELHTALEAFKNDMGADSALLVTSNGGCGIVANAFDASGEFFIDDGKVCFGPTMDNYKQYLQYMNKLYDEKLIADDFSTISSAPDALNNYVPNGRTGVFSANFKSISQYEKTCVDENAEIVAVASMVMNKGDQSEFGYISSWFNQQSISLSVTCSDIELACRWVDYSFSDEGAVLSNYGVEGKTFNYGENGEILWTEYMTANPDGRAFMQALLIDTCFMGACYKDYNRENSSLTDAEKAAQAVWQKPYSGSSATYPRDYVTLSAEESESMSSKYADIQTCVLENTLMYITGQQSLDTFDDFVQKVTDMGLNDCVLAYQAAYDRYKERG